MREVVSIVCLIVFFSLSIIATAEVDFNLERPINFFVRELLYVLGSFVGMVFSLIALYWPHILRLDG